jgi:outer membrane receptor protein involved in Fe transport
VEAKDTQRIPVNFADVYLSVKDSVVKFDVTRSDGSFTLHAPQGSYGFLIKQLGDTLYFQHLDLGGNVDMGVLQIKTSGELQTVSITAQKPLIERKVDRLVFNVENSVAATGGDALDALKVTPGVQVRNDNVSLIGKSNMLVLVDDKQIFLSGDDLMNYLKSIPSDNIKSIEVITTPPAKYEAEGNSGIINIVLKKAKEDSWNLRLGASGTQANYFYWNPNVNFSLQKGKWSVLAGVSGYQGKNIYTNDMTYQYPDNTYWKIYMHNITKSKSITPNLTVGYNITDKLSAGIQYTGSMSSGNSPATNTTNIYNSPALGTLNALYDNTGITKANASTHSFNFNMQQKLDSTGKKISLDVDYFINRNDKENPFYTDNYYYEPAAPTDNFYTSNNSNLKITNFSTQLDFEMPYKWAVLNYGGKISFTQNHSYTDGSFYQTVNGADSLYLLQTDNFIYKENNQALYVSAERNFGKKWAAKAGLRMEATQTDGISQPNNQPEQTNKFNYTKLFPTAYLSYKLNDKNTFTLDYSRRIQRPGYDALNPAKWYQSLNQVIYGNPFLQPSFTQNVSFSHTYKSLITSQIWYAYTQGDITQFNTFDSAGNTAIIRENYANDHSFGITESVNWQIFKWWNTSSGLNTWYMKTYTSPNLYQYFKPTYFSWGGLDISTNNSFNLNKDKTFTGEIDFWYNSPGRASGFYFPAAASLNAGLKYQLLNKKLQLALFANNILRTDKTIAQATTQNIKQSYTQYYNTQYLRFSVSYSLGNDKIHVNKHEGSNNEEKGRL